jgi:hypothetical protein
MPRLSGDGLTRTDAPHTGAKCVPTQAFKNVCRGPAALKGRKIYPKRTVEASDAFSGGAIDRGNLETNALNYRTELECSDYKIICGIVIRADAGSRETRRLQSQPARHRPELKIK